MKTICSLQKTLCLILILGFAPQFLIGVFAQQKITTYSNNNDTLKFIEASANNLYIVDKEDTIKMSNLTDTTVLKMGKKQYTFVFNENDEGYIDVLHTENGKNKKYYFVEDRMLKLDVAASNDTNNANDDCNCNNFWKWIGEKNKESNNDNDKMRGHWSGFEIGLNDFMTPDFKINPSEDAPYMNLNNIRSWNINLNFAQNTLPIVKKRLALVSGFGVEFNHYHFHGNNNIQKDATTGNTVEWEFDGVLSARRSKFTTMHITAPLLLEMQLGNKSSKENFYFSAGVIGGYKLASAQKVVHFENNNKRKFKERGSDINLNVWRYGLTARIGKDEDFNFYATYYLTPIFEKDKGPELYPFAVGFRINI